ncbi:MAG: hypothetical protein Q9213_007434 [Squamulea squamosa]
MPMDGPDYLENNEHHDLSANELERDLSTTLQSIQDGHSIQSPNLSIPTGADIDKFPDEQYTQHHKHDEATFALPLISNLPIKPLRETIETPEQQSTSTLDIVGISLLGAALLYHYPPSLYSLAERSTSWASTLLPRPKATLQLFSTAVVMLMPLWISIVRAFAGFLHWLFFVLENYRLEKLLQSRKERVRLLQECITKHKEILALQGELIELKKQADEVLEQVDASKKRDGGKKKKKSRAKIEGQK